MPKWPEISDDPMYQLLRQDKIAEFNARREKGETAPLSGKNYRGLDLRDLNADGLDFSDAYFRSADLRGIDFRQCILTGASLAEAKISGCFFPDNISPEEIRLSVEYGTRLRANTIT